MLIKEAHALETSQPPGRVVVSSIGQQLADAALNSGLANVWLFYSLKRQQRSAPTDVDENVGHLSGDACEGFLWRYWCLQHNLQGDRSPFACR